MTFTADSRRARHVTTSSTNPLNPQTMINDPDPNDRVIVSCNKRYAAAANTLRYLNQAIRQAKRLLDSLYSTNSSPQSLDKDTLRLIDSATRLAAHLDNDLLAAQEVYDITDMQRNKILQEEEL